MLFLDKQHLAIGKITYFQTDIFFIYITTQTILKLNLLFFFLTCDYYVTFKKSSFLHWFMYPIVNLYWFGYKDINICS